MLRQTIESIAETRLSWSAGTGKFEKSPSANLRVGFVKGPIPLAWIIQAASLPGKTLQVGVALWYLAGLKKSRSVTLDSKTLNLMSVSRDAKSDALRRLEKAGLVTVERRSGRLPIVSLLDI